MTLPPPLPLALWEDTKRTLHLYLQIVGKVRLALHPKLNHWWYVTFYLSPRGLTTGAIPVGGGLLELDFTHHRLTIASSAGPSWRLPLNDGLSVAEFYGRVLAQLAALGVRPPLLARPYDPARVGSGLPFADDTQHARYDAEVVGRFWQLLAWTHGVFTTFRGGFNGKSSPVHLFWHSFDLAHTRFSGRAAPRESGGPVDREAYSHELVSFGFWAGDKEVPEPSFYSYTYPEPPGLRAAPLEPTEAHWSEGMALLPLEHVRSHTDPAEALLDFLESTYRAGPRAPAGTSRGFGPPPGAERDCRLTGLRDVGGTRVKISSRPRARQLLEWPMAHDRNAGASKHLGAPSLRKCHPKLDSTLQPERVAPDDFAAADRTPPAL